MTTKDYYEAFLRPYFHMEYDEYVQFVQDGTKVAIFVNKKVLGDPNATIEQYV